MDYAGRPADLRAFRALAKKYRLVFIEDGAQALGAEYRGKPVGTQADMTMFSFHPVKSITTGEGGVIVTNNASFNGSNKTMLRSNCCDRPSFATRHRSATGLTPISTGTRSIRHW